MAQKLSEIVGASSSSSGGSTFTDNRTWKNWQDFYGDVEGFTSDVPNSTRDPGNTTGGTGTGAQNRKVAYGVIVNWTVPTGVTKIRVSTIGGGGAGGCRTGSHYYGGDGGGGAGFASGEFNVTGGEVLDIIVGRGGKGAYPSTGQGNAGTATSVAAASGSGGAAFLSVSSVGGGGGSWSGNGGAQGTGAVSGTALSGNSITYDGGVGGNGSGQAFGFGPEGYCSAGGGASGHFLGQGGRGGHGPYAGYTWAQGGGGGINGRRGGQGSGSTQSSATTTYDGYSGAGGGSRTDGDDGVYNSPTAGIHGGQGYSDIRVINDYTEDVVQDNSQGQTQYYRGECTRAQVDWLQTDGWYKKGKGVRYGDGITDAPVYPAASGGGGTPGTYVAALKEGSGSSSSSGGRTAWITMDGDAFNGILGRCTGGGAAGVPNNVSGWGQTYANGIDGGSGGGGSGSACSTTNWRSNNTSTTGVFEFDTTNLAWGMKRAQLTNTASFIGTGHGGAGGACGGGGGGGPYACAGPGGLGAGGGGGGGHYNPPYGGNPGPGGPGYVLIEW